MFNGHLPDKRKILLNEVFITSFIAAFAGAILIMALNLPGKICFVMVGGTLAIIVAILSGNIRLFTVFMLTLVIPLTFTKHFLIIPHLGGAYSININLSTIGLSVLYLLWVLNIYPKPHAKWITTQNVVFFVIIPLSLLSLINTGYYSLAGFELISMSVMFLLFFYFSNNIRNMREVALILLALLIMAVLQSSYGIMQYISGSSLPLLSYLGETKITECMGEFFSVHRVGGTMGHPNILAGFLEITLPISLTLLLSEVKFYIKTFLLIVLLFGTMALILSLSRGGWIGFCVALLMIIIMAFRKKIVLHGYNFFIVGIILSCFIIAGLAFSEAIILKLTASSESSIISRIELMKASWEMIKTHPLIGVGINSFDRVLSKYDISSGLNWGPLPPPVHNIYLLIFSETGIVGFASFLLIVIFLYRLGFRILNRTKDLNTICIVTGILAGLTGLFVHQMVDWILRIGPIKRTFWLMVGILAAIDRLTKQEELNKKIEKSEHTLTSGEITWPR